MDDATQTKTEATEDVGQRVFKAIAEALKASRRADEQARMRVLRHYHGLDRARLAVVLEVKA